MLKEIDISVPEWINLEQLEKSSGKRVEIYSQPQIQLKDFIFQTKNLFGALGEEFILLHIGPSPSWGDYCLDTWNITTGEADYSLQGKCPATQDYLLYLEASDISPLYQGGCICRNWDSFLPILIKCLFDKVAPYSPLLIRKSMDAFFYFHHSGSWGVYLQHETEWTKTVLERARESQFILK